MTPTTTPAELRATLVGKLDRYRELLDTIQRTHGARHPVASMDLRIASDFIRKATRELAKPRVGK